MDPGGLELGTARMKHSMSLPSCQSAGERSNSRRKGAGGSRPPRRPPRLSRRRQPGSLSSILGMKVQALEVRTAGGLEETFKAIVKERPGALLVMADRLFLYNRQRIMDFATRQRLPGVHAYRDLVEASGNCGGRRHEHSNSARSLS